MDDGAKGQAVPPGAGEVSDVDARVALGGPLGPAQQRLLRRHRVIALDDVRYL